MLAFHALGIAPTRQNAPAPAPAPIPARTAATAVAHRAAAPTTARSSHTALRRQSAWIHAPRKPLTCRTAASAATAADGPSSSRNVQMLAGVLTPTTLVWGGAAMAFLLSGALGANDVANSLGTSVGTGAVTLNQALIIGAVMEFTGAVLFGSTVTRTISSGVVTISAATLASPSAFMLGMLTVLAGCTIWMAMATKFGLPVSSTHSVVGSLVGLGLVSRWGINYAAVANIVLSWVLSPLIGGIVALAFYLLLRRLIENADAPAAATKKYLPALSAGTMFVLSLFLMSKGQLSHLLPGQRGLAVASGLGLTAAGVSRALTQNWVHDDLSIETQRQEVQGVFKNLQIVTACLLSFSHGSNDVSNAIGPFAALWSMKTGAYMAGGITTPVWVLVLGGVGISLGLAAFGRPVMETVGTKITSLVPTKGFCIELATASTVLVASEFGLPVSTTHTLVGCIVAIGLATGQKDAVNGKVLGNIALSWGVTLPVSAMLTVAIYMLLLPFLAL